MPPDPSAPPSEINGSDIAFLRNTKRPPYEGGDPRATVVDLFSGCGGLTLGVAEACRASGRSIDVRLSVELEDAVRRVYDSNFKSAVTTDRTNVFERFHRAAGCAISAVERATSKAVGRVDFLVGGPPCQGHSDLNNHTRRRDPKNELYMVMVRAAEVLEPSNILIENVQGVRNDHSGVLERAAEHLVALGYSVDQGIVRMADIGVPQRRVRHVLVASLGARPSLTGILERARIAPPRDLRWAVSDLLSAPPTTPLDTPSRMSSENLKRANYLMREDKYDLPNSKRPPCHRNNPDHRYTAMYGRLRWDEPAHTITTGFGSPGQGRYLHPEKPRTLTPHEAARLQFFPDWFDFSKANTRSVLAHCVGNAVPSKLSFVVGLSLLADAAASEAAQQRAVAAK
jgi:DNA (cytosine-5)-methyltransferase 1